MIPLAWVEAANERWYEREASFPNLSIDRLGVDVARSGMDKTVLALRAGNTITELRRYSRDDTMITTGRVKGVLTKYPAATAVVDVIGIGAGVVDKLREDKHKVVAFNAAEKSTAKDRAGELGFLNKRAQVWWALRELLDPTNGEEVALPPDDTLTGDLTAPKWTVVSGGKYQIESKDDIKKRIGRSTDDGDAVAMAFYEEIRPTITMQRLKGL